MKLFGSQFPLPAFHAVQVHPSSIASANYALDFDGTNDYVALGGSNINKPCTVEAWTKKTSNSNHGTLLIGGDYRVRLDQWSTSNLVGFTKSGTYDASFNKSTTLDEWVHVAIVFTSDSSTLFINGAYHSKNNQTNFKIPTSYIGTGGSATITATIDELRIWNDARTAAEIADNMEIELDGDESNLVAYYKMSDGSGTTLTDNSSNSNNGTLTNMVTSGGSSDWVISYAPIANMHSSYKTDVEAIWQNIGTDDSSPSNGLYMTMGSALTEQNWAVFGNNNTSDSTTSDLPSGVGLRSGRIWQVAERGTVAPNITIAMNDATGLSTFAHSATANKFLSRSGTIGNFAILTEGSSTSRANKTVQFNSVSLDSGYYYALGIASSLLSDGSWGSTAWLKAQDFDGVQDRAYQSAGTSTTENPLHRSTNGDGKAWTVSAVFNYNDSNGWPIWHQGVCEDAYARLIAKNSTGIIFNYGDEGN
ncbi:MAG TPA: LamG domain-containing protein, partial [Candidatus Marinimicrobia bacterium]|nr:LamG domain-containing protein [Candidatus Neomarinimicrobiota bacterium]